jgi:bifunctional (S)-malyl-CoA lyase/thioesterase
MSRTATVRVDDVEVEVTRDRMWDEATYQAAMTPVSLVQEVYEARPDQREELEAMYGERVVDRAMDVG